MENIDKPVTGVTNNSMTGAEPEMFEYKFRVKLRNGEDMEFKVPSKVIMMESPLSGYKSANGTRPMLDTTNRLVYKPLDNKVMRRILVMSVVALVVGLLIGAGVMFAVGKLTTVFEPSGAVTATPPEQTEVVDKTVRPAEVNEAVAKPAETAADAKPAELNADAAKPADSAKQVEAKPAAPKTVDANVVDAVRYLEDSDVWNRAEMEEYAPLKGLWDALNTRSFRKVMDKKYDVLAGSGKFARLRAVVKELTGRQWNTNYTSPGDDDITIENYIVKHKNLISSSN